MAPRIVSWGANAPAAPPVSSSSPSIVSFDSIPSDMPPQDSLSPIGTRTHSADSSTGGPSAGLTPANTYSGPDDSFLRHDTYFFKDGNITFLVDGTLYCVHRFFFSRDSVYFSTRLAQLGTRDHEALTTVVSLGDVEREDFEALLSVIYPKDFEEHNLSYQQWKSVLHLSTRWGFVSIRKLALKTINPPTPHDRLMLARTYAVHQWVAPALTALCERAEPLSLTEARQMRIEDVVLVAAVREDVRSRVIRVDGAKVTRIVEAALVGKLPHNEGNSAARASTEGGAAKQGTDSTTAASPVGVKREGGTQSSGGKCSSEDNGVAKLPEANATQGVGNATQLAQSAPKHEGEQVPGLFSMGAGGHIPKQRPLAGKLTSLYTDTEKSSTSACENPTQSVFGSGQLRATPFSPPLGTIRRIEIGSRSAEPATKQATAPGVNPADSKAPAK